MFRRIIVNYLIDRPVSSWRYRSLDRFTRQQKLKCSLEQSIANYYFSRNCTGSWPNINESLQAILPQVIKCLQYRPIGMNICIPPACNSSSFQNYVNHIDFMSSLRDYNIIRQITMVKHSKTSRHLDPFLNLPFHTNFTPFTCLNAQLLCIPGIFIASKFHYCSLPSMQAN